MEKSRLMLSSKLLFSLVACQFVIVVGQIVLDSGFESWYMGLEKPFFAIPIWLFIPLRSTVLLLLGIALFLVLIQIDKFQKVKEAFVFFMIQIVLNVILNIAFLGLKSPLGGTIVAIPTTILAIIVTIKAYRISYVAGILTLPYLVGLFYTVLFDFSLFVLNK